MTGTPGRRRGTASAGERGGAVGGEERDRGRHVGGQQGAGKGLAGRDGCEGGGGHPGLGGRRGARAGSQISVSLAWVTAAVNGHAPTDYLLPPALSAAMPS